MSSSVSEQRPIVFEAGVQPSTEKAPFDTRHLRSADKIRFNNGKPQKVSGHTNLSTNLDNDLTGTSRSIFSAIIGTKTYTVIGSNTRLFSLLGTQLKNITPLQTSTTAIAASLATHYATLGADPISTTNGSTVLTITDSEYNKFQVGDTVTLSGASTTNGVPDTEINADHTIRSIGSGTYTIRSTTAATSTGSGGGASVVRTSGLITVTAAAHGQADGDRVKLNSAADTGGIVAAEINVEHIIRNKAAGAFDVMTSGTATSSVSGGGGAGTTYQKQIAAGLVDESFGQGYGAGLYGIGLYGTALTSSSGRVLPRIWFFDKYGSNIIGTPGNQTGVYTWDGDTTEAPTLITNAPTAVNYAFVSDNTLVTLGAAGTENRVFASDQGTITQWTSSSTNSVFDDNIEGAGKLISHTPLTGLNLLHTETQVYTFRKIPRDAGVWEIKLLDSQAGLIAAQARCAAKGIAFWMGVDNFYMFRGGRVEVIPSNTQQESTILKYVFEDINRGQKSKIFCWYNPRFDEVRWHYPSSGSDEPDRVAVLSLKDFSWWTDTVARTGAEYPNISLVRPRLVNVATLYKHENGVNDDSSALSWSFTTPLYTVGKHNALVTALIPDSIQTGSITVTVKSYRYPMSTTPIYNESYTVSATTERVDVLVKGRYWNYTFSGTAVDGDFVMGNWLEELQGSGVG